MWTVILHKQKGKGHRRIDFKKRGCLSGAIVGGKNANTDKRTRRFNIYGFCQRQSRYLCSLDKKPHIHAVWMFLKRFTWVRNCCFMYLAKCQPILKLYLLKKKNRDFFSLIFVSPISFINFSSKFFICYIS